MATSRRLSIGAKNLIINYRSRGLSTVQMQRLLKKHHGISTSRQSIRNFLNRTQTTGSIHRRRKKKTCLLKDIHFDAINMWMSENPELTSEAIQKQLLDIFCVSVTKQYVGVLRRKLGWCAKRASYCQLISKKNIQVRWDWCLQALIEKETFEDVIFTDETSIEMSTNGRIAFYRRNATLDRLPSKMPKPKHAYKVHMWGGISYRGRTDCCLFTGIMDSVIYQGILRDNFLPFVRAKFPDGYRLYQDNDSKHKSKSTLKWMQENGVANRLIVSPASSPDLNPIENVWATLKDHLQKHVKPRKRDELVKGIRDFWESLSSEKCGRYIDHIHRVIPQVVLNRGESTIF